MKNLLVPAAIAASLAFGSAAFALSSYELGTIKAIDTAAHTVTMSNGVVYVFPSTYKLDGFKVGEEVRITFTKDGSTYDATAIKAN